ncbi:hypothetical protein GJ496_000780, partial [Pomphorhynchus laevis]
FCFQNCIVYGSHENTDEIDYTHVLNSNLPKSIRVLCWSPVSTDASARFDCTQRIYHYYFFSKHLDLSRMTDAAQRLIGENDYRNFCKMDIRSGVIRFIRRIDSITFDSCHQYDQIETNDQWIKCVISGSSFLWHQVRCMMSILFLVGLQLEEPSVMDFLLDIEQCPSRPNYHLANETPLVLYDSKYDNLNLQWFGPGNQEKQTAESILASLRFYWSDETIKSILLSDILNEQLKLSQYRCDKLVKSNSVWPYFLPTPGIVHNQIRARQRAGTLEERLNIS